MKIVTPIDDFSELSSFFIVKNINTQSFDTLAKGCEKFVEKENKILDSY